MNSHIAIIAKDKPLTLPDDFQIDIDDQNPVFNDNEMFSYPVSIPMDGNRFLFGNVDDPMNVDRPVNYEHTPMKVVVEGMPFRSGLMETTEDEEIDGALMVNLSASEHSLTDLINGLSCNDIPVKDKILIGEKIGNVALQTDSTVTVKIMFPPKISFSWGDHGPELEDETRDVETTKRMVSDVKRFTPQALGFSYPAICETQPGSHNAKRDQVLSYANGKTVVKPKIVEGGSFINVDRPYPFPYCNARVCYKHYGISETDSKATSSDLADSTTDWGENAHYPYWVLEADRPQSGICFYVLYFLDCLFHHLGYSFDNTQLLQIEDLKRLCFFTTHCKFDEETRVANAFSSIEGINEWLASRGCGGKLELKLKSISDIQEVDFIDDNGVRQSHKVREKYCWAIRATPKLNNYTISADIMGMYANGENFPNVAVSTVIDSLYKSFGIRFHVDDEKRVVRAYLVREIFRSQEAPIDFPCQIISMNKVAENYTGFRMKYSAEASAKDQLNNVKRGEKAYNTDYDYIDYPQNSTITNQTYAQILKLPKIFNAAGNTNVYIDLTTGNAYRIKVSADANTIEDLKPVLFEVGAFKGVELGDCSELNEDHVFELSSDFVPISFNDISNGGQSYVEAILEDAQPAFDSSSNNTILAAYIDEDMEHEFLEKRISQLIESSLYNLSVDMVLSLVESYDPQNSADGNSPLQSYDWGLSVAIMRGGGTNAYTEPYDFNYDGFGNSKWRSVNGDYAVSTDSIDAFGNSYDYNGTGPGINYSGENEERFSLKIRAWKQPEWADAPLIVSDEVDGNGNVITKIKTRGLFDSFWSEYAHFLLNRRKYRIKALCSSAQVAEVANNWTRRFRIGGLVGYINKLSYSISAKEGMKDLEVEFFVM